MLTHNDCPPKLMGFIKILRIPKVAENIVRCLGAPTSACDIERLFIVKVLQQEAGVEAFRPQPYFSHVPLDLSQDTFRLCKLYPAAEKDEPIVCDMIDEQSIDLAEDTYEALSYTWGQPSTQSRWINLSGTPFHVQPNLFDALKSLRGRETTVALWIDAICINQIDSVEKNHQVSLMGQIYTKAKNVAAWIGPETPGSEFAFQCLELMALSDGIRREADGLQGSGQLLATLPRIEPPAEELRTLCRREYWQRAWIRQEFLLAKDITLYCGSSSISWAKFGVQAMVANVKDVDEVPESRLVGDFFFHRQKMNPPRPKTLEAHLNRYGMSKCSDLRDRVLSLLSLSSDCVGCEKELIDYSIKRTLLFFNILAHCAPAKPSIFASQLQDILQVRTQDLVRVWLRIGNESTSYQDLSNSTRKTIAVNYVWAIQSHTDPNDTIYKSTLNIEEGNQIATLDAQFVSDFIARSHECQSDILGMRVRNLTSRDLKDFAIEDSEVGLLFQPTLFGYVYQCCTLKRSGGCQPIGANLEHFQETNVYRLLNVIFKQRAEAAFDADLVRTMIGLKEGERRLPATDGLCLLLDKLRDQRAICLIECRFIITGVFGHALLEPHGVEVPD